jgi:hypothetical protein
MTAGGELADWLGAAFVAAPVRAEPPTLELRCVAWRDDAYEPAGLVSSEDGRFVAHRQPGLRATLDRVEGSLVAELDLAALPSWERAKPLSLLLGVWLSSRRRWPLHAGAVASGERAALFFGAGGSGKSTAALVCSRELAFLGDDCVALAADGSVHAVYATAALDEAHLLALGLDRLQGLGATEDGKRIVRIPSERPAADAVLLLLPRIVGSGPSRLVPATAPEALIAAAPSSLLRRAVPTRELLARLRELVERVPCAWLELGGTLDDLPDLVRDALAER